MILCDAAQESQGKLFILGGGWSQARATQPIPMAIALKLEVPWNQANERHKLELVLVNADGQPFEVEGSQVRADGDLEVGRPVGLKPGSSIDVPLAFQMPPLPIPVGEYRWELRINGTLMQTRSFRIIP